MSQSRLPICASLTYKSPHMSAPLFGIGKVAFGFMLFWRRSINSNWARFQKAIVYYPLSVWLGVSPCIFMPLRPYGNMTVFGTAPLYNSSMDVAFQHHTLPHILFMASMFLMNDSRYTGGCEACLANCLTITPLLSQSELLPLWLPLPGRQLDSLWSFCHSTDASVFLPKAH